MATGHDLPDGSTGDSAARPEGDEVFTLRVRAQDRRLCLFNVGRPAPSLPEQCVAFAAAVAHQLGASGRHPPAPGASLDVEDQDGNLLAYTVVLPWEEQLRFALYSAAGELLTVWPPAGGV